MSARNPKIIRIIEKIQAPINKAIDWVLNKAKAFAKKIGGALGIGKEERPKEEGARAELEDNEIGESQRFSAGGESHRLWVDASSGAPKVMIASEPSSGTL